MASRRKGMPQSILEQREKGFDLSGLSSGKLDYNPLYDSNLRHFFESGGVQRILRSTGMLDSDGRVIDMDRFKSKVNIIEQEFRTVEAEEEQRRREEEAMRKRVRQRRYEALERARQQEKLQKMRQDRKIRAQILRVARGITPAGPPAGAGAKRKSGRSVLAHSASAGVLGSRPGMGGSHAAAAGLYGQSGGARRKGKRKGKKKRAAARREAAGFASDSPPFAADVHGTHVPAGAPGDSRFRDPMARDEYDRGAAVELPREAGAAEELAGSAAAAPPRASSSERAASQAQAQAQAGGAYDYIDVLAQEARKDAERMAESARSLGGGMGGASGAGTARSMRSAGLGDIAGAGEPGPLAAGSADVVATDADGFAIPPATDADGFNL